MQASEPKYERGSGVMSAGTQGPGRRRHPPLLMGTPAPIGVSTPRCTKICQGKRLAASGWSGLVMFGSASQEGPSDDEEFECGGGDGRSYNDRVAAG
jgi:hypothetical protein